MTLLDVQLLVQKTRYGRVMLSKVLNNYGLIIKILRKVTATGYTVDVD